ncbi:MAG: nitroreductase family protein [bacterium]
MEIMEIIRKRRSVRSYQSKEVEQEKLDLLLEAARLAPSASNRQEWRFIVVREFSARQKLMAAAKGQSFVGQAPVVIACCAKSDNHIMACGQPCYPIDVAIAIDHITLKATEEGLGTCWVGAFDENEVKKILNIPEEIRVVELLTLGYPQQVYEGGKNRLDLNEIVMYEKWEK